MNSQQHNFYRNALRSKRAETDSLVGNIPFLILFLICLSGMIILFLVILASISSSQIALPESFERKVLLDRLLTSPSCLALTDAQTGYPQPFIIDINKLTETQLTGCFLTLDKEAYRITVKNTNIPIEKIASTKNWVKDAPIDSREPTRTIVFTSNNQRYTGQLSIEVQHAS
jgi:hypothetical protein